MRLCRLPEYSSAKSANSVVSLALLRLLRTLRRNSSLHSSQVTAIHKRIAIKGSTTYRVTDADSGREIQFVFRVNW